MKKERYIQIFHKSCENCNMRELYNTTHNNIRDFYFAFLLTPGVHLGSKCLLDCAQFAEFFVLEQAGQPLDTFL